MPADRKCSECNYYRGHLDFGHKACLEHRVCHTREGYDHTVCEVCGNNMKVWDPISTSLPGRLLLATPAPLPLVGAAGRAVRPVRSLVLRLIVPAPLSL